MKVYRRDDRGVMLTAEVIDGAECMEIGALPDDRDEMPIEMIDYGARIFARRNQPCQPFPAKWYRISDLVWEPVA